jgi:hypothetical protein
MKRTTLLIASFLALAAVGCGSEEEEEESEESPADYEGFELLNKDLCDPAGTFSLTIDNAYFPLTVGMQTVLEGVDEGETKKVQTTVLDETQTVAGVETRVVEESEWTNGIQVEISRNFYAQAADGTVCYFGEDVDIYEDGAVVSHDGAWRAGENGAAPGIQMPASPKVGVKFALENAPGVAEDMSAITTLGDAVTTPAGEYTDTVRFFDWNPLESLEEGDLKYYAKGVGLIVDVKAELTKAP